MKINRFCVLILISIAFLGAGGAAKIANNSVVQYLDPEFITASIAEHGPSLLSVVAGQGQEGLRRPLAAKLTAYLVEQLPEEKFIGAIQTLDPINDADLTEEYARMIDDYAKAATLNNRTLRKVGETTGIRYLLHVKLLDQSHIETIGTALLSDDIINLHGESVNIFGLV